MKWIAAIGAAAALGKPKRAAAAVAVEIVHRPPPEYTVEERLNPFLAGRVPKMERVALEMPPIAEDGSVVPLRISVDSAMTDADHVRSMVLIVDNNPDPLIFSAKLNPDLGGADWKLKIRMRENSKVRVIAEMSNGELYMGETEVEVHMSGCG